MADITKATGERTVTYTANTPRADVWMRQRFGGHTQTFDTLNEDEREAAIALEAEARALQPPMTIDVL